MADKITIIKKDINRYFKYYANAEVFLILLFSCIPLFIHFPFRINIFLSWEGAYRMSHGEIPFRDFGIPMGYMFWVIPAIFFKIFGPYLITLIKAQVLINIISGFAFRSILKSVNVSPVIRLLSILLFCLSYISINFWPWYNHTVIVFEFVALAFLMRSITGINGKKQMVLLLLSSLFTFISFFTKQDGGALCFLMCIALLIYVGVSEKRWKPLFVYSIGFLIIGSLFIYPLTKYNFGYWFNHGQPPHQSRISGFEILDEFFYSSQWIKFYLFLIIIILIIKFKRTERFFYNKAEMVFLLLTLGILAEATVIQITSYTPPDGNIFFHSFAFAYIFSSLSSLLLINLERPRSMVIVLAGLLLWWSGSYWKYIDRLLERMRPAQQASTGNENVVNRKTFILNTDSTEIPQSAWVYSSMKYFKKIYLPEPTVEGMERISKMDVFKKENPKVLNMTELTPLAAELHFSLEKGDYYPLWYHLGVGMFNKQANLFENRIRDHYYDLVLFEYIPTLNNFYPFRTRESLMSDYNKVDSFYAPRSGNSKGIIEVYLPKK